MEGVENGQNCHRVSGGDEGTENQAVDGVNLHVCHIADTREDKSIEQKPDNKGGNRGSDKGIHQDRAKVPEEVFLHHNARGNEGKVERRQRGEASAADCYPFQVVT